MSYSLKICLTFNAFRANLRILDENRKADMHAKMSLRHLSNTVPIEDAVQSEVNLEIFFLACSTPRADASKFISDWIELLHACKDAHNHINKTINDRLRNIEGGKAILEKLYTIPIILMQVYRQEVKFAILDRPYGGARLGNS